MKKIIIIFVIGLLTQQITQAQGTITYASNVGQSSIGSNPVGSDSWLAAGFETGTNTSGYLLNSIQLEMTGALGNPSDFMVMLYSAIGSGNFSPGSSLGTLTGSTDPATGDIYTYIPASNLTLSSDTAYFIVLTAGTAIADDAYEWSYAGTFSYNSSGGWQAPLTGLGVYNYQSSDGSHWNFLGGPPQFAISATPIPEPSSSLLLLLGGGAFIYVRRAFRR